MKKTVGLLSPPTVFMVFGLPCAEIKIGCHGCAARFVVRFADGKTDRQGYALNIR